MIKTAESRLWKSPFLAKLQGVTSHIYYNEMQFYILLMTQPELQQNEAFTECCFSAEKAR